MAGSMYRRMAAIYAREGWTWTNRDGQKVDPFVPTAEDIKRSVVRLSSHLENGGWASSGRILVKAPAEEEADYPGARITVLIEMGHI